MRPGTATAPQRSDYVLAAIVVTWGVAEDLTLRGTAPAWLQLATGVIAAAAVLFRRSAPIGATAALLAMLYLRGRTDAQTIDAITPIALVPLMFYSIARHAKDATRALIGCVVLGALMLFPIWDAMPLHQPNQYGHAFLMLLVVASSAAGWIVRRRALEATRLRHERDVIVRSHERALRVAAVEETLRIAGELNSYVRAAIGEASAQSAAAVERLEDEPDVARERLSLSAQAARNAIGDLRRLLTVLRNAADPSDADSEPPVRGERTSRMVAVAPAAAVAFVSIAEVLLVAAPAPMWSRLLGAIAVSLPLFWQRRFPLTAAVAVAAIVCGRAALDHYGENGLSAIAASAVAVAGGARFASPPHAAAALAVSIAGMAGAVIIDGGVANDLVMVVVLLGLSAVAATAARRRAREVDISRGHYAAAAEERERLLGDALAEVRRQIARDTHDSVGHSLASMNMHAEAAMLFVSSDRSAALAHIESVGVSAREAIAELERLLGGFDPQVLDERATPFGVAEIDALVRESGLDVQLRIECQPLPNGADATVYLIVKEALVNVGKHAPGAAVSIDIHEEAGMLRVSVVNAQSTEAPADLPGGHGLAGMRERVLLFDGGLTAGARPDGGWAVVATLPVRAPVARPSPQVA